jgi:hypothetical protein
LKGEIPRWNNSARGLLDDETSTNSLAQTRTFGKDELMAELIQTPHEK